MQKLPRGYYAVQSDFENASKDTFVFRGVTYAVEQGVNLFGTPHDADAAAAEVPEVVLEGLDYASFDAPVLLFSTGRHNIDRFRFSASRYWLGEKAGVNPNLPAEALTETPVLNPERSGTEEGESVLKGGYDYGTMYVNVPVSKLVLDGFACLNARFCDSRSAEGTDSEIIFRNIVQVTPCGKTLYYFSPQRTFLRDVLLENVRLQDFDDLQYGGLFMGVNGGVSRLTIDNLCYDTTEQLFGFTDMSASYSNVASNCDETVFTIKNSYFRNMGGENGIRTNCQNAGEHAMHLVVEASTFLDASRKGQPVFRPHLPNAKSTVTIRDCAFIDTRSNACAIQYAGVVDGILIENCDFEGFATPVMAAPEIPTEAPDRIENRDADWESGTEDSHTVLAEGSADFSAMDALYEGKKAYYCDQHTHTACGGTSDGTYPMKDWVAKMDALGVDFAIVVDHRQMRGFFLPEWDTDRFVYGTEPGGGITDLKACNTASSVYSSFHYNMLFPHEYGLAMVLANFPEFKFKGDELTGKFGYPKFTKERFDELVAFIHKIGGMMVHPHPATLMASSDPLDYYFGERTYLETLYGTPASHASFRNHALWCKILALGKHMLAAGGTDAHGTPHGSVVSTFYCPERTGKACFDCMKSGDYAVGDFGMKMCVDGAPMGSENVYREGMTLTLRLDDYFAPHMKENTVYELRIYSDEGLVYASRFNGKEPQAVAIKAQKRRFYRAEVYDITHGVRVGVGNPVWLDKAPETAEQ